MTSETRVEGLNNTEWRQNVNRADQTLTLPTLATASDVREVVRLLKRKPEGVTLIETHDAVRKRIFDPRKVFAYELWGIVSRVANRLILSQLGWEFAARLAPETEIYRTILRRTRPYQMALEWMHQNNMELVTYEDVGGFWQMQNPEALDGGRDEAHAISFFHLCHAAEIGMATVGRKGQPTRLSIYRDELGSYLRDEDIVLPKAGQSTNGKPAYERTKLASSNGDGHKLELSSPGAGSYRVFVSQGQNHDLSVRLQATLELANIESHFIERKGSDQMPLPEQTHLSMQQCQAGIIVITQDDCARNTDVGLLDESLLIEVGAAFGHFDKRVVLLTEKETRLPASLLGLDRYEFDGVLPSWEVVMQLTNTVKRFRPQQLEALNGSQH